MVLAAVALGAAVAGGCGSSGGSSSTRSSVAASNGSASSLAPTTGTYAPKIDPADFVFRIDNRWFPLIPGTGFHYRGVQ